MQQDFLIIDMKLRAMGQEYNNAVLIRAEEIQRTIQASIDEYSYKSVGKHDKYFTGFAPKFISIFSGVGI